MASIAAEKAAHLVLVKPLDANVSVLVFIVIVKLAALAGRGNVFLKLRKIHSPSLCDHLGING